MDGSTGQGRIFDVADEFRSALIDRERQAAIEITRAYRPAWEAVNAELERLLGKIATARAAGERVDRFWLMQAERLTTLRRTIEEEMAVWSRAAEGTITAAQRDALVLAGDNAERLVQLALGPRPAGVTFTFARLPREALADLVGFLRDGSPLRELLDTLGPQASAEARETLITGLALGQNPRTIAYRMRGVFGGVLSRALAISRTEILRSYREAAHRNYRHNGDVVKGWIWHSALGTRTCAACWAMHGTFHSLDERLDDHPCGRCSPVPVTKTWAELGIAGVPETRVREEPGAERFWKLSEAEQVKIVGPTKLRLLREGRIELRDLVQRHRSAKWGTMRGEASIVQALANAARRRG